jgi:hypothetical protein
MPDLNWYTSNSADDQNHDQETDLAKIGNPGGAEWASVSPDGRPGHKPWNWEIYDRWIDVDEEPGHTLAYGKTDTEDLAKAAVAGWVALENIRASLRAENISYGELQELQNLVPYITSGDTELLEAAGVPEHPGQES